ncbi:response regulator [Nonomuraea sp. NPDC049480]|uniref:response regulator transcription factor n=1 Tax=Nonomuraea sp. NPDC049480 TaxID=3364353 RepID=UPI0037B0AAE8
MAVNVVLAEDQEVVRAGLRLIIDGLGGFRVVAEAADGEQAVTAVFGHRPDVVLMDVQMPVLDGVAAVRRIHEGWPHDGPPPPVLMLTTFDAEEYVLGALRAGAVGYVLKTVPPEGLAAALLTASQGGSVLSPQVARKLIARVTREPTASSGVEPGRTDGLTGKEQEVLSLIAHGLSNAEIATRLGCSESTVKSRVARAADRGCAALLRAGPALRCPRPRGHIGARLGDIAGEPRARGRGT